MMVGGLIRPLTRGGFCCWLVVNLGAFEGGIFEAYFCSIAFLPKYSVKLILCDCPGVGHKMLAILGLAITIDWE